MQFDEQLQVPAMIIAVDLSENE